jgi:hypothetical protein
MIEENIPIPDRYHGGGRIAKYQFADLQVGQSMWVPTKPATDFWRKKTGFKFVTRAAEQESVHGWRIWRVQE